MSVKQLSAVFEDSKAEGAAFQVALALADWADHAGWCHPSYSQIQRKAHIRSRATVLAALDTLEALGELKIFPRGYAPTRAEDDDVAPPIARQFRNRYRLTVIKSKAGEVVQPLNHQRFGEVDQPSNQPASTEVDQELNYIVSEVVQPLPEGGSTTDPRGSSILDAHIRNSPSVLTVNEPSAAALAAADPCEAVRLAWNDAIAAADRSSPIPVVFELTPERRRIIQEALHDRPFDDWVALFARVAASSFCRGGGQRGWVADLWWLLTKPDAPFQVDEGKYDDHFSAAELTEARRQLFNAYGAGRCPHTPTCDDGDACARRHALALRTRRAS